MNCPECHGSGVKNNYPCDYEGCFAGRIHCCDGLVAQATEDQRQEVPQARERE